MRGPDTASEKPIMLPIMRRTGIWLFGGPLGRQLHPVGRGKGEANGVYHTHMSGADLIRELKRARWRLDRVNGSHHVFIHPLRPGIVVVPHPKKDLGTGLVKAIRHQAGI